MDEIISQSAPAVDLSEQEQIRRDKLAKLREEGCDPYLITRYDRTHTSQQILDRFEELENQTVCVAGRMMSRRIMGKASFAHLQDNDGKIQVYVRRDDVGEEAYARFKQDDVGDIIAPVAINSPFFHLPFSILPRMCEHSTEAEQPQPLPPA